MKHYKIIIFDQNYTEKEYEYFRPLSKYIDKSDIKDDYCIYVLHNGTYYPLFTKEQYDKIFNN